MPTLPDINPETTTAGIAIDPKSLERVVPATRRADGSVRKELKIRPGFTPQEDLTRFKGSRQQDAERNALPRGHILGWVAPSSESRAKRGGKTSASSSGRSLEALAAGEVSFNGAQTKAESAPLSKSAKKNAKRAEKKREEKQRALDEKIKAAWDDDSDDDIPRPAKKGKSPVSKPDESNQGSTLGAEDTATDARGSSEVADKLASLNI